MSPRTSLVLTRAGQGIAVVSGLTCAVLVWLLLFANPYAPAQTPQYFPVGFLVLLAVLALVGAVLRRPLVLVLAFLLSFVPLGYYLFGSPGVFKWVGVAHFGYLAGAILLFASASRRDDG